MKKLSIFVAGFWTVTAFFILKPVPQSPLSQCTQIEGVLAEVSQGGSNDVCLRLENHPGTVFYVNRGLENGLAIDQIQKEVVGKQVKIAHPKYWTPLDPFNSTRHVSMISYDDQILFDKTLKN